MTVRQEPVIRLGNISKSFGKVQANSGIDLEIHHGRILALLGENGAGKSTLMSILAGRLQPDSGTLYVNGEPAVFSGTDKAIQSGVGMVYQHFKLVQAMSVAENIFLGHTENLWVQQGKMNRQVAALAERYNMPINPASRVADLSMGEKQQVEILKLLHRKSSILIFDEPTAVLTPKESEILFATMRKMAVMGKAIVFISHKLEEVLSLADDIAILRHGRITAQMQASEVKSTTELAQTMVGRAVLLEVDREPVEPKQIVVKVTDLAGEGIEGINFELRQGEVLGLVGVAGNGQKQLVETLCGLSPPLAGNVRILGMEWKKFFSRQNWDQTLSYIPEDRQGLATCGGLNLLDNFLLTTRGGFTVGPWLKRKPAARKAKHLIGEFNIRPPDLGALAWQLSGGNLQKMVLAREFFRKPRLIVAEQPTQGLDIAAAQDVWNLLLETRDKAGILLITGDLAEAFALSDRIGVMYGGRLVRVFAADDHTWVERIPEMMAGIFFSE
ncbi:MAG: branched-chain amino acid ABC transporter ATP-binding protein [Desulfobulbus propionicus]|nr:MAG: branched-chain amino acid ABC transporter ATP-binding protein [Desulfobulbus propionicus]